MKIFKATAYKNWWFLEGVNTYFGWLADIRDSVVNESDFMGH